MTSRSIATTLLALAAASSACRSSSSSNPDAPPANGDGSNPDDVSIFDIQDPSNKVAVGASVTVRGVVVTAIDNFGDRKGGFWVAEPAGGAFSGVMVFGASTTDVAAIKVGDLVDITGGIKAEFAIAADTSIYKTTQIAKPTGGAIVVTKTGTGTVPSPEAVDALAIGKLATKELRFAEWEKWEGVLIKVDNVSANGAPSQINGDPLDPTFKKFPITGVAYVESSLAAMPDPAITSGACLASVTGIGDYFFDPLILPRTTAEIVGGGTGCPAAEVDCTDTIDNDGNGFLDCDDRSCQATNATCVSTATVVSVQNGTTTGAVSFKGVVVTAIDEDRWNFWIQDQGAAAIYNGVFVFRGFTGTAALDASIQVGTVVDVSGTKTSEFTTTGSTDKTTEIQSVVSGTPLTVVPSTPAATVAPTVLTPVTIDNVVGVNSEQYEGVLVELKNVKVFEDNLGFGEWTVGDAAQKLVMGDDIIGMGHKPTAGTCLATLRGVMHYNTFQNQGHIKLLPRTVDDIGTTGGTCP